MAFWLTAILLYVGTTIISALVNKANETGHQPGKPEFPTAEPNKPIPVVYGKVRVGLNVIHKAKLTLGENTIRGTAPFGWSPQHIGYFYTLDLAAAVCWGKIEALWDVIVDGSVSLADAGTTRVPTLDLLGVSYSFPPAMSFFLQPNVGGTAPVTISAGNILGGKYGRGGIGAGGGAGSAGMMRLVSGSGEVVHNARFEMLNGGPLPTYPNIAVVYFEDFYFGNSEQLPGIELVLSRSVAPWGGTGYLGNFTANSGNDALPGGILYDLLTNSDYGLGLPEGDIDGTSFESVNNACDALLGGDFDFGLSFVLTESRSAKDVLADLMRTLDAVLYTHPTTGLLTIRLLRVPGAGHCDSLTGAPTIDESVLIDGSLTWSESASDATVNEVRVEFPDKARQFTTNVATVRNVAAIQALGRVESRTVQFLGITNADLAQRVAQRELRALSTSLGRASFEVDRSGYVYTPGQFFYLTYADFGISANVMRVVSVRDTPFGTVAIEAVEDVYSSSTSSFTALSPVEPSPPAAQPILAPYVEEYATQDDTTGTLTLFVYDDFGVVASVEFQATAGRGSPSGYSADTYPYQATVSLVPGELSTIDWRVSYTDANGDAQTLTGSVTFGGARSVDAPLLSYEYDGAGNVIVTATVGSNVTGVRFASSTSAPPSDASVTSGALDSSAPFTAAYAEPSAGTFRYVGALATDGTASSSVSRLTIGSSAGGGGAGGVTSFNGRTGAVVPASGDYAVAAVTGAAPLASPALTGTPTAPTASAGTNTTQIATTAFVTAAVAAKPAELTPSITTASLADGATETGTVTIAKTAFLQKMTASAACWVRLYETAAARTSDASRAITASPKAGLGILHNSTPGLYSAGLTIPITPAHELHNGDGPRTATIYYAVTNKSGSAAALTLTLTYLPVET